METIASFQVDHTNLQPGIYISRQDMVADTCITTYDIRMTAPNHEPAVNCAALHTIEHLVATYLRNHDLWKESIIYWGPMGCLTGCYLIVKGNPKPEEICPLLIRAFEHCADYDDVVPGTTPETCGNYLLHDLPMAKYEARLFADILKSKPCFVYPTTQRITTEKGKTFFDS